MKKIGILNCGAGKQGREGWTKTKDMYTGVYFGFNWRYMNKIVKPDEIWIMTVHVGHYTVIPKLTKIVEFEDCKDDIRVMLNPEEKILPYETGYHTTWGRVFFRKALEKGVERWIEEQNIKPEEVEVFTLVNKDYHSMGLEPYFPNIERGFPHIAGMGYRMQYMKKELGE